jgi:hypothetical protein
VLDVGDRERPRHQFGAAAQGVDENVVLHRPPAKLNPPDGEVDAGDRPHGDPRQRVDAQVLAGGELVEAYPFDEPVGPVDQGDVGVAAAEPVGGGQARVPGAEDHDSHGS